MVLAEIEVPSENQGGSQRHLWKEKGRSKWSREEINNLEAAEKILTDAIESTETKSNSKSDAKFKKSCYVKLVPPKPVARWTSWSWTSDPRWQPRGPRDTAGTAACAAEQEALGCVRGTHPGGQVDALDQGEGVPLHEPVVALPFLVAIDTSAQNEIVPVALHQMRP